VPRGLTVAELKPFHVEEWLDRHPGWKTGRRGAITAVQRAFNWAAKQGRIDENPLRHIEKPPGKRREMITSQQEFDTILAQYHDQEFRDLLIASWDSGARPHELFVVEARHLNVEHAVWIFPPEEAKGKKHWRVVHLSERLLEISKRLAAKHPEGPIFRNIDGVAWTANAVNSRFERLKHKLGKRYNTYAFRHSFGTQLLESGVDALTVSRLLGHRDLGMLQKHYAHIEKNNQFMKEQLKKREQS
jgi:integrase